MMMSVKFLTVGLSVVMLFTVFELVRREKLTFKYAIGWVVGALLAIILSLFEQPLYAISSWLGFKLTSNFIFFTLLCVFIFFSLVMSIFLCQQDNRNNTMAQKIAILEFEIKQLKAQSKIPPKSQDS